MQLMTSEMGTNENEIGYRYQARGPHRETKSSSRWARALLFTPMHPATIAPLLFKSHRKVIESKGLRSSRSAALRRFKPPSRLWPHSDMLKKEKKINFGCAVLSGILPATQLPILLVATKSTACGSNLGTEKSYEDAGNSGSFIFDSGIGVRLHRKKVSSRSA